MAFDAKGNYVNPRRPEWPEAEYIVGNPPFIAGQNFRKEFGDVYAEAIWSLNKHISGGADFVMFWWNRSAELLSMPKSKLKRFGLVTTNSITQEFSRRVVDHHIAGKTPLSLILAIPNHPWTKATQGSAAVRIAMTVVELGSREGKILETTTEQSLDTDEPRIEFSERSGRLNPNFTIGIDVTLATKLNSNFGLCHDGVKLHGKGFRLTRSEARHLGLSNHRGCENVIKPYMNGRDLNQRSRDGMVIDLFGIR